MPMKNPEHTTRPVPVDTVVPFRVLLKLIIGALGKN